MKLLWRILKESDNIWVSMVTRKYLQKNSLWNHVPPMSASCQLKKLLSLWSTFRKGLRWHVGNGVSISFWFDNWVYASPLADVFSDAHHEKSLKVGEFIS